MKSHQDPKAYPFFISKAEALRIERQNKVYATGRSTIFIDEKYYEITGCTFKTMGEFHRILNKRRGERKAEQTTLL